MTIPLQRWLTQDGSHTLYHPVFKQHYHSCHGAIQESLHVFIQNGLKAIHKPKLNILECGFGTGLNAWLSYLNMGPNQEINYQSIDPYPVPYDYISELNYPHLYEASARVQTLFETMHHVNWDQTHLLVPHFWLTKHHKKIQDFESKNKFDLIYFDAFSPESQPELWTAEIFEKLYMALDTNGLLVTYCAKGSVKRLLKTCGFEVQSLPGPPGKREMVRAKRPVDIGFD